MKLSPISALAGAFGFCFSGFFAVRLNVNFVMIQVYTWLPLQLLFVHQFLYKGRRWQWLGLVGAMVMSLLAGHPQTTIYCWYLVIAYWLYGGYLRQRDKARSWKSALGRCATAEILKLVGTFALVFGIAAVMLLPGDGKNWLSRTTQSILPGHRRHLLTVSWITASVYTQFFWGLGNAARAGNSFWGADPQSPSVLQTQTIAGQFQLAHNNPGFWQYWECNAYSGQASGWRWF